MLFVQLNLVGKLRAFQCMTLVDTRTHIVDPSWLDDLHINHCQQSGQPFYTWCTQNTFGIYCNQKKGDQLGSLKQSTQNNFDYSQHLKYVSLLSPFSPVHYHLSITIMFYISMNKDFFFFMHQTTKIYVYRYNKLW